MQRRGQGNHGQVGREGTLGWAVFFSQLAVKDGTYPKEPEGILRVILPEDRKAGESLHQPPDGDGGVFSGAIRCPASSTGPGYLRYWWGH